MLSKVLVAIAAFSSIQASAEVSVCSSGFYYASFMKQKIETHKVDLDPAWVDSMIDREKSDQQHMINKSVQSVGKNYMNWSDHVLRDHNEYYSNEIPKRRPKDQCSSGRCWIFAGTNTLEGALKVRGHVPMDFQFSETYIYFFSMLERANRYLEEQIQAANRVQSGNGVRKILYKNLVSDGGFFSDFQFLVEKYGLVPKNAMPDTFNSRNSGPMIQEINDYLVSKSQEIWSVIDYLKKDNHHVDRFLADRFDMTLPDKDPQKIDQQNFEILRKIKMQVMSGAFKILETHLGTPPKKFQFRHVDVIKDPETGKSKAQYGDVGEYTPREFSKLFVGFNQDSFVSIAALPTRKRDQSYIMDTPTTGLKQKRGFSFLNLSTERMVELIKKSIDSYVPVYFAADFSAPMDSWQSGVMHPDLKSTKGLYDFTEGEAPHDYDKVIRQFHLQSYANHAVIIDAYDQPKDFDHPIKFRIENSWGEFAGNNGHYHMYLEWLVEYGFFITIQKEFLSNEELQMLENPESIKSSDWYL